MDGLLVDVLEVELLKVRIAARSSRDGEVVAPGALAARHHPEVLVQAGLSHRERLGVRAVSGHMLLVHDRGVSRAADAMPRATSTSMARIIT